MKTRWLLFVVFIAALLGGALAPVGRAQAENPNPPAAPVKLIFIHHSTGENWLTDDYGNLGRALAENNYFVSDTNYGWGPDAIGDRTDIPNWVEWFRSEQTPTYMAALFAENEQHANYTRTFGDPGDENEIVLFKSCFPNSDLEGTPNDAPDPDGWLSVGHAKYVYNQILQYFATRPDKLFIVITAPPLSDGTHAANARAFNEWLRNDWLAENNYTQANVAVFDFYNVLTSPNAHHRYANGSIEHLVTGSNTLAYPSDDDHPSVQGSQKATDEFVPLLNIYYNRWRAANPPDVAPQPQVTVAAPPEATTLPEVPAAQPPLGFSALIDDFESACRMSRDGWQTYRDEATNTQLTCAATREAAATGAYALQMVFDIAPNSWGTCDLPFDAAQDWRAGQGIRFDLHSEQAGSAFNVDVRAGAPDSAGMYVYTLETTTESVNGWQTVEIPWGAFARVAWEENGGAPLTDVREVLGVVFGFESADARKTGKIWVDNLQVLESAPAEEPPAAPPKDSAPPATAEPAAPLESAPPAESAPASNGGFCAGGMALPFGMFALVWGARKRR